MLWFIPNQTNLQMAMLMQILQVKQMTEDSFQALCLTEQMDGYHGSAENRKLLLFLVLSQNM
jgi:hypothetical protein